MSDADERTLVPGDRPVVRVRNLAKAYGRTRVLDGVGFDVHQGQVLALLGANGAGKTTTLSCMLGITPFEGSIKIDGIPVERRGKQARRLTGYVPQTPALGESETCRESLRFLAELKGAAPARVAAMLELVNLTAQADMRIGSLSGGMRQRLALAAALLADPPLLLLDEPTASLDAENRREFHVLITRLRDEGKTIILSTHAVDRLDEIADRVLVLDAGRVVYEGTPRDLRDRAPRRRYVVTLNGNAPSFEQALRAAGLDAEGVLGGALQWEDLLLDAAEAGRAGAEEAS